MFEFQLRMYCHIIDRVGFCCKAAKQMRCQLAGCWPMKFMQMHISGRWHEQPVSTFKCQNGGKNICVKTLKIFKILVDSNVYHIVILGIISLQISPLLLHSHIQTGLCFILSM